MAAFIADAALAAPQILEARDEFIEIIEANDLTRFGVRLTVSPSGEIGGSAFGQAVRGIWEWDDQHFCRDFFGEDLLDYHCFWVEVEDTRVRFVAVNGDDSLELWMRPK